MGWALFRLGGGAAGDQFRPGTTAVIPLIWQLSELVWRCRLRLDASGETAFAHWMHFSFD